MKYILLTQGKCAIVDDGDFDRLNSAKWYAVKVSSGTFYAKRQTKRDENGKQHSEMMHRKIMGTPRGKEIDHINGNGLDNRRENLRVCNHWENTTNQTLIRKNNKTGFLGVSLKKTGKPYRATIRRKGIRIDLGCFDRAIDASQAYQEFRKNEHVFA